VNTAHGLNLDVHAWTINEVNDMKRLLALGVEGIVTDYGRGRHCYGLS
jgi:glycerophosphoryl diester phosphodiesterase